MWPEGRLATRHPGGLAIDPYRFVKKRVGGGFAEDWLDVERDFVGRRGAPVCGEGAGPTGRPRGAGKGAAAALQRTRRRESCDPSCARPWISTSSRRSSRPTTTGRTKITCISEVTPGVQWHLVR